jgi:nucleoid DNA-binding protein
MSKTSKKELAVSVIKSQMKTAEGEPIYYVQGNPQMGQYPYKQLLEKISSNASIKPSDLSSAFRELGEAILSVLFENHTLYIENVGTFRLEIGLQPWAKNITNPALITSSDIHIRGIHFTPDTFIQKQLKDNQFRFKVVKHTERIKSPAYGTYREPLRKYLAENTYITPYTFSLKFDTSIQAARRILKFLNENEEFIREDKTNRMKLYVYVKPDKK